MSCGATSPLVISLTLWLIVAAAAVALELRFANRKTGDSTPDARAMNTVMVMMTLMSMVTPLIGRVVPALAAGPLLIAAGFALGLFGLSLRAWAMTALGVRYALTPQAQTSDHFLVIDGPYRIVRHPGYTGIILQFLGMGLMLSPIVAVVAILPLMLFTGLRIVGEEKILHREFATDYPQYARTVRWRLLTWIY